MPELVPGLVSVIVPIYNVEPFLRDCLDSLRAQTYPDLQVLVVDDGSTDGCAAIAGEFAAADPRFELIRQANAGLSAARNVAVPVARGEYLAFVDSDDVLAAHAYELLVQAMAADLVGRGHTAIEAFGDTRGRPDGCVLPAEFWGSVGFGTQRAHPTTPRMRMELRTALNWKDEVEAALERIWGVVRPTQKATRPIGSVRAASGD